MAVAHEETVGQMAQQGRPSRRECPATIPSEGHDGAVHAASRLRKSKGADLVVELLELLELETISSALGRTKPARFRRSRIIWPLMLMSSGELEWRLWGKDAKRGKSQNLWDAAKQSYEESS